MTHRCGSLLNLSCVIPFPWSWNAASASHRGRKWIWSFPLLSWLTDRVYIVYLMWFDCNLFFFQDIARLTFIALRNEKINQKLLTFAGPRAWTTQEVRVFHPSKGQSSWKWMTYICFQITTKLSSATLLMKLLLFLLCTMFTNDWGGGQNVILFIKNYKLHVPSWVVYAMEEGNLDA